MLFVLFKLLINATNPDDRANQTFYYMQCDPRRYEIMHDVSLKLTKGIQQYGTQKEMNDFVEFYNNSLKDEVNPSCEQNRDAVEEQEKNNRHQKFKMKLDVTKRDGCEKVSETPEVEYSPVYVCEDEDTGKYTDEESEPGVHNRQISLLCIGSGSSVQKNLMQRLLEYLLGYL